MPKVDIEVKYEIVFLFKKGLSIKAIHKKNVQRGTDVSFNAVKYHVNQYQIGNFDIGEPPLKKMRTDGKLTENDIAVIKASFKNDPYSSSADIKRILKSHGTVLSSTSVKRAIAEAGYVNAGPRYCQLIRKVNMEKRVQFCTKLVEENETFDNVIFTDECSVQFHNNKTTSYRQKGMLTPHEGKPKHPLKIHVWGGISRRGTTGLLIFDGILKSDFFVEEILGNTLLPFTREAYGDDHRFQQDNDPKHRSKLAQKFMTDNNINWWNTWPSGNV